MRSFSLKERLKCVVGLCVVLCFSRFYRALLVPKYLCVGEESPPTLGCYGWVGTPTVRRSLEEEGILYEDRSRHCLGQEQESFGNNFDKTQSLVGGHWRCELCCHQLRLWVCHGGAFGPNILTLEDISI